MLQKMATSCISALMSKDIAYLPIKVALDNGATLVHFKGNLMIFEELSRNAIYIVGNLADYLDGGYSVDFKKYRVAYFYDEELGEYFKTEYPKSSPLLGFYVFENYDNHLVDAKLGEFKKLDESYFDLVYKHYAYIGEEATRIALRQGRLFGLFDKGNIVGFIGLHDDHTIGMLRIFKEYQRHGYGYALEGYLNNYLVNHHEVAYCHVEEDNEPSLKLQHKLGLTQSKLKQYWLFNEE